MVGTYPSENGMMGMAGVDGYQISYKDGAENEKDTILYISFYDYVQPKIPVGFYSIQDFDK